MKKMKKMSKRGLALLMSLLMCMSMLNLTAFAEEGEAPAEHSHTTISCATCGGNGTVDQTADCPDCEGPAEGTPMVTCPDCGGNGNSWAWIRPASGSWPFVDCPGCGGRNCDWQGTYEGIEAKCVSGSLMGLFPCSACNGAGQVPDQNATVCATCGGTGTTTTQVDCEACENGQVPCTGAFNEGVLTAVNADGTGTKTFTCETCGVSYIETIPVEEIAPMLASNIAITGISVPSTASKGNAANVSVSVKNSNQVAISGVNITVSLGGLEADGAQDGVVALTTGEIPAGQTAELTIDAKVPADAAKGTVYTASVTEASYSGVAITAGQSANVEVITMYKSSVEINGGRMAYWYGYVNGTAEMAEHRGNLGVLEGRAATFSSIMPNLYCEGWTEQFVKNYSTDLKWQCIGFVPVRCGLLHYSDLSAYVYGTGFDGKGGKSGAESLISELNGIFYGDTITSDKLSSWDDGEGIIRLIAVWYIPDTTITNPTTNATPAPITPVVTETEKPSSTGVTVTFANKDTMEYIHQNKEQGIMHGGYDAQIVITITPDAPVGDVHVNIDSALKDIAAKINALERFEPGDEVRISITVDNQSGREYAYKDRTIMVSTKDLKVTEGTEVIEGAEGFDGNKIPSVSNDDFSIIPRRILNVPLQQLLGKGNKDTSDDSVGAKLAELGYGLGEGLSNADIAKKYLGTYYVDWVNKKRELDKEAGIDTVTSTAKGFQDFTVEEAISFTNGDTGTQTKETSASVAEGLYHFYYGKVFTVNGTSVYDHMVNYNKGQNNESNYDDSLNNQTAGLLTNGVLNLIGTIAGEKANNAFQNTKFGFRVEFDLTVVPTSTPTPPPVVVIPTPTPTPTATPTPTPEPTEEPTPTPEPDEEIPDEDVPLGTPKPEPTPEPDEEIPDEDVPLGTPKPEPTPDPDEEIPDPDVPLGPSEPEPTPEPEEEIPDEDVPLANTPKTGDNADIWFLLSVISAAGLVFLGAAEWKKRKGSHGA